MFKIPESEIKFSFSRSGGAGGQNVNKVETKVAARWDFQNSGFLNEEQKELIKIKLENRLSASGNLIVSSQAERSQRQNLEKAVEILNHLVNLALRIKKKRKPTKVPRGAKEKRLNEKKIKSKKKSFRKKVIY